MSNLQNIQIISEADFIKQAKEDAYIEVDSDKCEGCPSLVFDQCGSGQTLIECAGGDVDDHCLQLLQIVEDAAIEYEGMIEV